MVVPLPYLRHLGIKPPHVLVHQVVSVVTPEVVDSHRDMAFGFSGQVAPDATIFHDLLGRNRAVCVDSVATVQEKIRQASTHGVVDAHAAYVRVDAEPLTDRITTPYKTNVPRLPWHTAQVPEPRFARCSGAGVLEPGAIKDGLIGGQPSEFHPGGVVSACMCLRRSGAPGLSKSAGGVPLNHQFGWPVTTAPDHRAVTQ